MKIKLVILQNKGTINLFSVNKTIRIFILVSSNSTNSNLNQLL